MLQGEMMSERTKLSTKESQLRELITLLSKMDNTTDRTQPTPNYTVYTDGSVQISVGTSFLENCEFFLEGDDT